jgi:periplasmic copper chaperone A
LSRGRRLLGLALCSSGLALALVVAHEPELVRALAVLAPAAVAYLSLRAGRYPAERALVRLSCRRVRRPHGPANDRAPALGVRVPARGGRLVAMAMARRGPPAPDRGLLGGHAIGRRPLPPGDPKLIGVMSMKRRGLTAAVAVGALLVPASADAHISLHPNTIPAGAFATVDVRVPGEQEGAYVTKVDTEVPPGFVGVDYANVPGWSTKIVETKLATPVTEDGETIDTQVSQVIWTWKGPEGKVENGQFVNFPLSVAIPDSASGKALEFRTVQTYSNGHVVHWIEPSLEAEHPSPRINITAKGGVVEEVAGDEAGPTAGEGAGTSSGGSGSPPAAAASGSGGGSSEGIAIAALIVAVLGLAAGAAALVRARGSRASG